MQEGWQRHESRNTPGLFYFWHCTEEAVLEAAQQEASLCNLVAGGWQAIESASTGRLYFFHQEQGSQTEAPHPWIHGWVMRESTRQTGLRYMWHPSSGATRRLEVPLEQGRGHSSEQIVLPALLPSVPPVAEAVRPHHPADARPGGDLETSRCDKAASSADLVLMEAQPKQMITGEEGSSVMTHAAQESASEDPESTQAVGSNDDASSSSSSDGEDCRCSDEIQEQVESTSSREKTLFSEMLPLFREFLFEMVKGAESKDPLLSTHACGGLTIFAGDSVSLLEHCWTLDVPEVVWATLLVIWLGAGGPQFKTFQKLHKKNKLPTAQSAESLESFYKAVQKLVKKHGINGTFSGDGLFVRGGGRVRKSKLNKKGAKVKGGREMLDDLPHMLTRILGVIKAGGRSEDFGEKMNIAVVCEPNGFGELASKELAMYLSLFAAPQFPKEFRALRAAYAAHTPSGHGAQQGAALLLGLPRPEKPETSKKAQRNWHMRYDAIRQEVLHTDDATLAHCFKAAGRRALKSSQPVREAFLGICDGKVGAQGLRNALSVVDIEVACCWFQSYLSFLDAPENAGRSLATWDMVATEPMDCSKLIAEYQLYLQNRPTKLSAEVARMQLWRAGRIACAKQSARENKRKRKAKDV